MRTSFRPVRVRTMCHGLSRFVMCVPDLWPVITLRERDEAKATRRKSGCHLVP